MSRAARPQPCLRLSQLCGTSMQLPRPSTSLAETGVHLVQRRAVCQLVLQLVLQLTVAAGTCRPAAEWQLEEMPSLARLVNSSY